MSTSLVLVQEPVPERRRLADCQEWPAAEERPAGHHDDDPSYHHLNHSYPSYHHSNRNCPSYRRWNHGYPSYHHSSRNCPSYRRWNHSYPNYHHWNRSSHNDGATSPRWRFVPQARSRPTQPRAP